APQVTNAEELPATNAIPVIAAHLGAGSVTSRRAGVQRKVYQSGHPPRGLHTRTPMTEAAKAMATPPAIRRAPVVSGPSPRKSAAVGTISAETDTRRASCHVSQRPTETPSAGGVIPRPRLLMRYGAIS